MTMEENVDFKDISYKNLSFSLNEESSYLPLARKEVIGGKSIRIVMDIIGGSHVIKVLNGNNVILTEEVSCFASSRLKEKEKHFFDKHEYSFVSGVDIFNSSRSLYDYCNTEIFPKKDLENTVMYLFPSPKNDYNSDYHFTFLEGNIDDKEDKTLCEWTTYHCYPNEKAIVKTKSEVIINAL